MRLYIKEIAAIQAHVSIHASVKDATTYRERLDSFNPVSIHASVKDATVKGSNAPHSSCVSIHASVKDATPCL